MTCGMVGGLVFVGVCVLVSTQAIRRERRKHWETRMKLARLGETWLIKDFNILYRVALDVSESIVEPDRETPPQRNLRAQLERLRPAFTDTEEVRRLMRERQS